MKNRILSMLVLLLTAATGAWAQSETSLTPDATGKVWTLAEMPAYNVQLVAEYYPVATGTAPAAQTETIYMGTTTALVTAGSSEEGTLMYLVSATAPTTTEGFSETVPTAENITEAGSYNVYYYIKGDDTHSDSEISATPVAATVLSDKFDITFADDTAEPTLWKAEPATDVKKGTDVTVTYTGSKKVIGVKAEKKASAAPRPLAKATAEDLGKIAGADGNIYDTKAAAEAANTTAVAMIAYVGSSTGDATYNHGLALALTDEVSSDGMTWEDAKTACSNKNTSATVKSASWMLPSKTQWETMGATSSTYTTLRDGFTSVGGSNLESYYYWSSTGNEDNPGNAWMFLFSYGIWYDYSKDGPVYVRACLAF